MAAVPSRLRSRTMQPWTTFGHVAGSLSPHRASASASCVIGAPARTTSADSTTRSRGPSPLALALDLERAEHGDTHPKTVALAASRVNAAVTGADTAPTPGRHRSPPQRGGTALHPLEEHTMSHHHPLTVWPVALAAFAVLVGACTSTDATTKHRRHHDHAVVRPSHNSLV